MKKLKMRRKVSAILIFVIVLSIIIGLITGGIITLVSEAINSLVKYKLLILEKYIMDHRI